MRSEAIISLRIRRLPIVRFQMVVKRAVRRGYSMLAPSVLTIRCTARPSPLLFMHAIKWVAEDVVLLPVDVWHAHHVLRARYRWKLRRFLWLWLSLRLLPRRCCRL